MLTEQMISFISHRLCSKTMQSPCEELDDFPFVLRYPSKWFLYIPPVLTLKLCIFCLHSVFMCFLRISEETAFITVYSIN